MSENICEQVSFGKVYFKHAEHLRNFLYYKSGDLHLAEDITQDAFSKLWEKCDEVVFSKAKSFLFTIANNLFLNKVKRNKVSLKFIKQTNRNFDKKDPQYLMEEKEFKSRLEKVISELPETQREVFLMNRIDGMKYKEIAALLGVSVKAIEKRMHKALKVLKNEIGDV